MAQTKPNKSNLRKWVKALRSGKYRQTRGSLKGKYGFCCLGVACDISGQGQWENGHGRQHSRYLGNSQSLPLRVLHWLGLSTAKSGDVELQLKSGKKVDATTMNDASHYDFHQIADAIERTFKL